MSEYNTAQWPGWETVRLIGRGSFGAVYEIQRNVFDDVEKAALKVISIPQNASDIDEMYGEGYDEESITSTFQSHLKSIVSEYSLMKKMSGCTNIVNCDDIRYVQHDDGIGWDIFIKMELLTPLMKALPADIPEEMVIKVARDICVALELCKEHGIVHRDIKPQNIFVSSRGDYKLGDFGIAKTVEKTMGGTKIGTYKYMAPEVYNNQPYGSSADIYSLGLVLYWLLNEKRMPFLPLPPAKMSVGMEDAARQRRFSGETLPAPKNGSEKLKAVVLKACAFDPRERYSSATEMLVALNSLQEKQPIFAPISAANPESTPVQQLVPQPEPETALQSVPQPELAPFPQAETVFETKSESEPTPIPAPDLVEKTTSHTSKHKKNGWWPIFIIIALAVLMIVCITRCNSADEREITEISVSQLPKQQEYCVGDTLNVDGLVIEVEYSDGTTEQMTSGFYCPTTKFSTTGRHSVHVYYLGHHTSFDVYVEDIAHTHNWMPADCDTPKTCIECGETSGSAAGHSWTELSSRKGEQCSRCGEVVYYCSLNYTDVTLELGKEFDLELTAPDSDEALFVQWTADSGRVLISGNSITAVSPGDTVVSAEYDGKVYSCIVRVRLHMPTAPQTIAGANWTCLVGLKADGTVVAVGSNSDDQCDVGNWRDIVSISAGNRHTAGLKADGTVVAVGSNSQGQCDVGNWTDIVSISAGGSHTVGLKADGTVVAVGSNDDGECDVGGWRDIVAVSTGPQCTVGLKANGTVVAVGKNSEGRTSVSDWTDIVAISIKNVHTVGLKADGTVVAVGHDWHGQCDVGGWRDIVAISAGTFHTVGLRADGTVVAVGKNSEGQCDVSAWTDIVAISAGLYSTIGLKADGTVVVAGWYARSAESWENIRIP